MLRRRTRYQGIVSIHLGYTTKFTPRFGVCFILYSFWAYWYPFWCGFGDEAPIYGITRHILTYPAHEPGTWYLVRYTVIEPAGSSRQLST